MTNDNTQTNQAEYDRPPTMREQVIGVWLFIKLFGKALGFFVLCLIVIGSLLNIIHPYVAEGTWSGLFILGLAITCILSVMYSRSLGLG